MTVISYRGTSEDKNLFLLKLMLGSGFATLRVICQQINICAALFWRGKGAFINQSIQKVLEVFQDLWLVMLVKTRNLIPVVSSKPPREGYAMHIFIGQHRDFVTVQYSKI